MQSSFSDSMPMNDPTEFVIAGCFVAAVAIFVISVLIRCGCLWKSQSIPAERDPLLDERPEVVPPDGHLADAARLDGAVPVWFYRPWDLVGAAFVFLVYAGLFFGSAGGASGRVGALDARVLVWNMGFQFIIGGLVVMFVLRKAGLAEWLGLVWSSWPRVFLIAPGAVILMWLFCGGLGVLGYEKWMTELGVETVQDSVKVLQQSVDPMVLGLMVMAALIFAPIYEEIVFRGFFYPVLKRFAGVWSAAVCSALVFAAAHGSLASLLPLFVFGLLLVWVYEKTGSIWAPMAVHFCFNSVTVIGQLLERYDSLPPQAQP